MGVGKEVARIKIVGAAEHVEQRGAGRAEVRSRPGANGLKLPALQPRPGRVHLLGMRRPRGFLGERVGSRLCIRREAGQIAGDVVLVGAARQGDGRAQG